MKVVSFDIWRTLWRTSPAFDAKRSQLFFDALKKHKKVQKVNLQRHFEITQARAEAQSEQLGVHVGFAERLNALCDSLGTPRLPSDELLALQEKYQQLALKYPPQLLSTEITDLFCTLKQRGLDIAVISNLGLISSKTVRILLELHGLSSYIDFFLFSDETTVAKPSPEIFKLLCRRTGCKPADILHIGDSRVADVHGAAQAGMSSRLLTLDDNGIKQFNDEWLQLFHPKTEVHTYAVYRLTPTQKEESLSVLAEPPYERFDPRLYSRFKYGDKSVAAHYAAQLQHSLRNVLKKKQAFAICSSAYNQVPTAATSIATRLHDLLLEDGYNSSYFKIGGQSFAEDYSTLETCERAKMLSRIHLSVSPEEKKRLKGGTVVVIDDIRVTGFHSNALANLLAGCGVKKIIFCYVAVVEPSSILHARVEWFLNHSYVKNLRQLEKIISEGDFEPNARVCKFLLASPKKQVEHFLKSVPSSDIQKLLELIISDGYHLIPAYQDTFQLLQRVLHNPLRSAIRREN